MEDKHIIGLFWKRQESAITCLQEKYDRFCRNIAGHILADNRDTEECVCDAYLRVWNTIPPQRPRSLQAYLARITRNVALDRCSYNNAEKRNAALTKAFEEIEPFLVSDREGNPEHAVEAGCFRDFMDRFLRRQTKDARIYFIRRYWYGESIKEIAAACGVGEEKVKSSLFRTRNRLQKAITQEGITL